MVAQPRPATARWWRSPRTAPRWSIASTARAMSLGAKDEGAPGPRGQGFYAGYFRDLDGNKLNVFFMG